MKLSVNIDLPDNLNVTRLDFGHVDHFSKPWSCWLQVEGKFFRGHGNSMQEAFDDMKDTFSKMQPVFEQRKQLAKIDIKDLF